MAIKLAELVARWDRDYEATLPHDATMDRRRPYGKVLEALQTVAELRFQPYRNDRIPRFIEKLQLWLCQFSDADQPAAFLLASRILYITQRQFETLQRRLFATCIRRHLLAALIVRKGYAAHEFHRALPQLGEEMDTTLFVANSDSSGLNSFVHLNIEVFARREQRRLVGPELTFWVYPARRAAAPGADATVRTAAQEFEKSVLATDRRLTGKQRLVVVEDFAGTGDDLDIAMTLLARTALPLKEVVLAPVITTAKAMWKLRKRAANLTKSGPYAFYVMTAHTLPHSLRCFDGPVPSYLDGQEPLPDLSRHVKRLSDDVFASTFTPDLPASAKYGYGALALAFAFFSNCPDNSLPLIWRDLSNWHALFPRASRYI
jgi:hypothetical protein